MCSSARETQNEMIGNASDVFAENDIEQKKESAVPYMYQILLSTELQARLCKRLLSAS